MAKVSDAVEKLIAAGRLDAAGAQVGQEIQDRINRKRKRKRPNTRAIGAARKAEPLPACLAEFVKGGMARIEHIAGAHARDIAIHAVREHWLPRLERWRAEDTFARAFLDQEIKRLRRVLGIPMDAEQRRAVTRARVAKWRARKARRLLKQRRP